MFLPLWGARAPRFSSTCHQGGTPSLAQTSWCVGKVSSNVQPAVKEFSRLLKLAVNCLSHSRTLHVPTELSL